MFRLTGKASALAAVANAQALSVIKQELNNVNVADLKNYIEDTIIGRWIPFLSAHKRYWEIKKLQALKDELVKFGLSQEDAERDVLKLDSKMYRKEDVCDKACCAALEPRPLDMTRFLSMATKDICYKFVAQDFGWDGEKEQPKFHNDDAIKTLYDRLRGAKTPAEFKVETDLYFSNKVGAGQLLKKASLKCTQEAFDIVKREILGWEEDETEFGSMQKHMERDAKKIDALDADVEKFVKGESKETLKSLKDRFDSLINHYITHHAKFMHAKTVGVDGHMTYRNLFDINGQKLTTLKAKMSALKRKLTPEEKKKAAEKKKADDKKKADLKAAKKDKWTNGQIALIVALIVVALAAIIAIAVCIMRKNKASEDDDESM